MPSLRAIARSALTPVLRVLHYGRSRYCPVCASHLRQFQPYGWPPRPDAQCPVCFSLERHRVVLLYLRQHSNLFDGQSKRMLHVAPEPQMSTIFSRAPNLDYVSADFQSPLAMIRLDITKM